MGDLEMEGELLKEVKENTEEILESISSPKGERAIIINRFFSTYDIDRIKKRIESEFPEESLKGKEEVYQFLRGLSEKEFCKVVDGVELNREPFYFNWFKGRHYNMNVRGKNCVAHEESCEDLRDKIRKQVREMAQDPKLYALLRGIIASGPFYGGTRFGGDWNDVVGKGGVFYNGDEFHPTRCFSRLSIIQGVETSKTGNGGRSFSMATEIAPLVWEELDKIKNKEDDSLPPMEAEVPPEIAKRKQKFEEVLEKTELTEEDVEEFKGILKNHDALDYWADYVAPGIHHRPLVKKAILCMLASPEDRHGNKGRTNILLYGPPSTGKSGFKRFLKKFSAYSIDGARVSDVDLTYNKRDEKPGLLVRSNGGIAVVEEADKMQGKELEAALTSLGETGRIEIRDMVLPAEVRGVMLTNFESIEEIKEEWGEPVLDRFEFIIKLDRLNEDELSETLDWHYLHFYKPKPKADAKNLKKYLKWVRNFEPEISESTLQKIENYKDERINEIKNVRKGIAVLTVAYTLARLNHRDLTLKDYERAMELTTTQLETSKEGIRDEE